MPYIYSPYYHCKLYEHIFPVEKYALIYRKIIDAGIADGKELIQPEPASRDDLLLVHTEGYLSDLSSGEHTVRTITSELPLEKEIVEMNTLMVGGTIEAVKIAASDGWAVHLGGGFHHAFPDRAEGFCYLNDIAVAVRKAQAEGWARRIVIVDLDLHQGNGTAVIFQDNDDVFTYSMHQQNLYPVKEKSDLDVPLKEGTTDAGYLMLLDESLSDAIDNFTPDLVIYQAGVDPFEGDQLGSLCLTEAGLLSRDKFLFNYLQERGIPAAVTLGGGYALNLKDTVNLHFNTCNACRKIFK